MGTDQNVIQATVVFTAAVMRTLLDRTFDGMVCLTGHSIRLLYAVIKRVCPDMADSFMKTDCG